MTFKAKGDIEVCDHHIVEDIGICLGQALNKALGNKAGIKRYGTVFIPMDEPLCTVTLDLSGRVFYILKGTLKGKALETFQQKW